MSQQSIPVMNRRVRRHYDAARRERKQIESEIAITAERVDGTEVEEVFIAHPGRIPGGILIDFMRLGVYQDSEAMWELFRCALDTEPPTDENDQPIPGAVSDFTRFHNFVRDPDIVVEAQTLSQIISDMVEDGSGFPTPPPAL